MIGKELKVISSNSPSHVLTILQRLCLRLLWLKMSQMMMMRRILMRMMMRMMRKTRSLPRHLRRPPRLLQSQRRR